jgi:hypothetical protein
MPLNANNLEVGPANVYFDDVLLGYMGDTLALLISTEVVPLTGAQAGTSPINKVVSGGNVTVRVPFKEVTMQNFARAIPNAVLVTGATSGTRLDIKNRVGFLLRSLAKKLVIKKIIAGQETTDPAHIIVIPEATPAESEITFPFSPTEQRILEVTFQAWPDGTTGRWAFMGDEFPL